MSFLPFGKRFPAVVFRCLALDAAQPENEIVDEDRRCEVLPQFRLHQ
jgi:hypothetical protein